MRSVRFLVPALVFVAPVAAVRAQNGAAAINQIKVDEAIDRGLDYLQKETAAGLPVIDLNAAKGLTTHELVFYTMVKGGAARNQPAFANLLDTLLKKELKHTYCVSLLAMALNALDPEVYQRRIAQCAQFLVDNQCKNGQWSYGKPVEMETLTLTPAMKTSYSSPAPGAISANRPEPAKATRALKPVMIRQRGNGPADGDNSNSQYATLGLRACIDSGIVIESKVLELAAEWWEDAQTKDGGWSYQGEKREPYGSMTAGGIGSLSILRHYLRKTLRGEKHVDEGLEWLGREFEPGKNPKADAKKEHWAYYYLYGVERVGSLYATPVLGGHDWYAEGSSWLLSKQKKSGQWGAGISDTCWAILFLRRATKPLVKVYSSK